MSENGCVGEIECITEKACVGETSLGKVRMVSRRGGRVVSSSADSLSKPNRPAPSRSRRNVGSERRNGDLPARKDSVKGRIHSLI
jgi:hypothetical protein